MQLVKVVNEALSVSGNFSSKVTKLTDYFLANGGYPSTRDCNHHFGKNVYVRELPMKRGTLIAGRVHKYDHVFILVKGKLSIWSENGRQILKAPAVFECKAGVQRVGYVHEDVLCMTAHGTTDDNRNAEEMWDFLTVKDDQEFNLVSGILEAENLTNLPQEHSRLDAPDSGFGY
jgi:quercetin dioxygenase-like cupin family protein